MKLNELPTESAQSEQAVIGALLIDNDAISRIGDLAPEHFYLPENREYFSEIYRQIVAGKRADVLTVAESLQAKMPGCLADLSFSEQNTPSAANIGRYAEIVVNAAIRRALLALTRESEEVIGKTASAAVCVDWMASRLEKLAHRKTKQEPMLAIDMMGAYTEVLEARMEGKVKPISTGFTDLDRRLGGGLERGTLTVVAGRPGTGKTALGLCLARNVGDWGCSLFLSMEMSRDQINDRNVAGLGHVPILWLRNPDGNPVMWEKATHAFSRIKDMKLFVDDQTGLNMLEIRNKSMTVKRKQGLDMLVIDQLSFITGGTGEKQWEVIGEYTRGLLQLAKDLNVAVVLLCQLNRECEKRPNKRPIMSDLASSGSIEQDAANILFLYRDELYFEETEDKGMCEVNVAKQRQGSPGMIGLSYIGDETRFENGPPGWHSAKSEKKSHGRSKGFE